MLVSIGLAGSCMPGIKELLFSFLGLCAGATIWWLGVLRSRLNDDLVSAFCIVFGAIGAAACFIVLAVVIAAPLTKEAFEDWEIPKPT